MLAIASEVFSLDTSGHANSLIYAITLASVAFVGVFGSHVINQSAPNLLGVTIALLSSSFILASIFAPANIAINYLVIFLVGLLNGLENPNNMRVFSALLEDKDKAYFFSFYQTIAQTINIISSAVGAYIINVNGIALAKVIAIILFAFSSLPWIIFYKKIKQDAPVGDGSNKSFY